MLPELLLGCGTDSSRVIEQNAPGTGGSLIHCHNIGHRETLPSDIFLYCDILPEVCQFPAVLFCVRFQLK
jgi:hypothetical protein